MTVQLEEVARRLCAVALDVRAAIGPSPAGVGDRAVVRVEGGDEIFGVDHRADQALLASLDRHAEGCFSGTIVIEGFDEPRPVGDGDGSWRLIADPVDGSRPWLAGKRSAWVLIGAGRNASTLADLEVSVCVEVPTARAAVGCAAWAVKGHRPVAVDVAVDPSEPDRPVALTPMTVDDLNRTYVSVQRFTPGEKARISAWEDEVLTGLETYEDPYLCSGGQLMEVAMGREAAVLDPRPLFSRRLAAHPYDLAGWLVAEGAGVIVEALPPGPLEYPLDTTTPCAWAAYANEAIAAQLRSRVLAGGVGGTPADSPEGGFADP
jgi:fructose-1,6-bisphosphatase/inositol monophosphatase family enzyme